MSDQNNAGEASSVGEVQVERVPFGMSAPGQPPKGYPNGPGIDMYGDAVEVAHGDPDKRTGEADEVPPPDPA